MADVNRDGKPDLLDVNSNFQAPFASLGVLLGNGNGTFRTAVNYDSGGAASGTLAVADLNGDTLPDVVMTGCGETGCANRDFVAVLLNATDTTPPVITISLNPQLIWPPDGKRMPITVSGTITDTGSGVNATTAAYVVEDEYGEVQPQEAIPLGVEGTYSVTVFLEASRRGRDKDGRRYTITIHAKDNAGNLASEGSVVTVVHDQGL